MSSTYDATALVKSSQSDSNLGDAIKKAKEDNDPQTVFYLNPISADLTEKQVSDGSKKDILTTEYYWATKIEQTVQGQFGKGTTRERHSIQASWDRASYRSKLLDYSTKTTPW